MAAEVSTDATWVDELIATTEDAVVASADAIAELVGDDGLPPPSPDYWERRENDVTLGVVAPLSAGLRAAIDLAPRLGVDTAEWRAAADRLDAAIEREFAPHGYPRTVPDGGLDAAVSILAPPFAPASKGVADAVAQTEKLLRVPNGGHRPGEAWKKDVDVAWTPETGMLALASAGLGNEDVARRLLDFLDGHRTALGALPEKVDANDDPASVAPLGWTGSLVLLTLAELEGELPVVPR
jgi:GH15 family glucan-1,4-alpha-glucosidase